MLRRTEKRSAANMAGEVGENPNLINITVKFINQSIPISISSDSTVKDLKFLLQSHTNVLARLQKLIFKGTLLTGYMTLAQSEVLNGTKIMLVGTPFLKDDLFLRHLFDETCLVRWDDIGVIALGGFGLNTIPDEILPSCGYQIRLLALDDNYLEDLPHDVRYLTELKKLHLDKNYLSNESTWWKELTHLQCLKVLSLSQNRLTTLPSEILELQNLEKLDVSRNKLTSLPYEIGFLMKLEVLKANKNRLCTLPSFMGSCITLVEVDVSSNCLKELPESLANLDKLKYLDVANNGSLRSLPSKLFTMCPQLSTVDFHNTEIAVDVLRQYEGWDAFDERQRLKLRKQRDFRMAGYAEIE